MKALVVCVSVCIVLGGFGGVVGQIGGAGQEGVDVVGNGVGGEPDLQGFEAQGEVQGADQEHQGFVIGGGTGSLRFGLVNALLGGAPAESSEWVSAMEGSIGVESSRAGWFVCELMPNLS